MNEESMEKFEALAALCSFDLNEKVNSAYRCPDHPDEADKTELGTHPLGHTIDYGVFGKQAVELLGYTKELGFTGIGVKQHGSFNSRFIHLDDAPEKLPSRPRPWTWSYS